jgi:hypothetical protein
MMKILFLVTDIRSIEQGYRQFDMSSEKNKCMNWVCTKKFGITEYFSHDIKRFDDFLNQEGTEILVELPKENEKYIIFWHLLDVVSFNSEILDYWNSWYNNDDEVLLRIINDLRNNNCSIVFTSLHGGECDLPEESDLRTSVINWFLDKEIPLQNLSYATKYTEQDYWGDLKTFIIYNSPLMMYRMLQGYTQHYFLGAFVNNLFHLRQKHFVSFNCAVSAGNRSKLVKFLTDNDYMKNGYVSYKPNVKIQTKLGLSRKYLDSSETTHFDAKGDLKRHDNSWITNKSNELIENYDNKSLSVVSTIASGGMKFNSPLHFNSYFNIITTTGATRLDLDDKIWKPIIHLQPFLIIGERDVLSKLRKLGFKTFHPYIDESYETSDNEDLVYDEIKRLCELSIEEIDELYWKTKDILLHNFNQYQKFCDDQTNLILNNFETHWSQM